LTGWPARRVSKTREREPMLQSVSPERSTAAPPERSAVAAAAWDRALRAFGFRRSFSASRSLSSASFLRRSSVIRNVTFRWSGTRVRSKSPGATGTPTIRWSSRASVTCSGSWRGTARSRNALAKFGAGT
jgi:hypothetical protein